MDKLTGPTNRVGGDFNADAIEAFRNAYAQQLSTPDEDTIANNSGLPTNTVPNTSPWIEHTGLWKAHDGRSLTYERQTPFNPNDYLSGEVIDGDGEVDEMSDEEVDHLVNEIMGSNDEDEEYEEE
jgi:hypothetical protein